MFDTENYFSTLGDYAKSVERAKELYKLKQDLEIFDATARWTEDPKLDRLRRDAKNAIEELYDALIVYNREETRRLFDKLDKSDSDEIINWDVLKKKLGRV